MTDRPAVALVGALDTKADEYRFVRDRLHDAGIPTLLIDVGVLGAPALAADVSRQDVARAAGADVAALARGADRAAAVRTMAAGAATCLRSGVADGTVGALLVLGGSNAGVVMRHLADRLPFGLPKTLVSTVVAGDTRPYIGVGDVDMVNPVVDLAGLNSISVPVLARAADALAGVLHGAPVVVPQRAGGRVGCSIFGVTTECVVRIERSLEDADTETQAFHANGVGGRTLERLIRAGTFDAVADVTTTELADELLGGVCSAGPDRLTAAADAGVPQVVGPGALDMVNFGPRDTVPAVYRDRLLVAHNDAVTLLRTSPDESAALGRILAERVNRSTGPVEVVVPELGFSQISAPGGPFADPVADRALLDALAADLRPDVPFVRVPVTINDPDYADAVLAALARVRAAAAPLERTTA